jgi:diguanylate cyclase (GGDEF)-like protein
VNSNDERSDAKPATGPPSESSNVEDSARFRRLLQLLRIGHLSKEFGMTAAMRWICGLGLVALTLIAIQVERRFSAFDAASAAERRLGAALHALDAADRAIESVRGNTFAGFLADQVKGVDLQAALTALRRDGLVVRTRLVEVGAFGLDESLTKGFANLAELANRHTTAADEVVRQLVQDGQRARERLAGLQASQAEVDEANAQLRRQAEAAYLKATTEANSERVELVYWMRLAAGLLAVVLLAMAEASLRAARRALRYVSDTAVSVAGGDLGARCDVRSNDELGQLAGAVNQMAESLHGTIRQMQEEAQRSKFERHLVEALEMVDTERGAREVVARAMQIVDPHVPMELLLADSSHAHLECGARHPSAGAAGCGVESPFHCIAVRRGTTAVFPDSDQLNACPQLRDRNGPATAAVCVPVSFMGKSLGVLHAATPATTGFDQHQIDQLSTLGVHTGTRLGTIRAFEHTQLRATTDALTGLDNRRSFEESLRAAVAAQRPFALVMADLDHFKLLNDKHGHQTGDEALCAFTDVARNCARADDLLARWGGEEFVFALIGADAASAYEWTTRVRERLAASLKGGRLPPFTASFGVADSTMAASIEELVRLADVALYQSKNSGRDCATVAGAGPAQRPASEHLAEVRVRLLATES